MSELEKIEKQLVDLWLPHVMPIAGAGKAADPQAGPVFVLTGWRGAGWRMIFSDELTPQNRA